MSRLPNIEAMQARGFTLIELLLVVAIIGIISTLGLASFIGTQGRARDAQRKSDLDQLKKSFELYRNDSPAGAFYPRQADLGVLADRKYIKKIPNDPKTGAYSYIPSPPGCGLDCTGYTLCATLERAEDPDIDTRRPNPPMRCPGNGATGNYGFTNP